MWSRSRCSTTPNKRRGDHLNNEPPKANEELGLDVSHEEDGKAVAVVEAKLLFFFSVWKWENRLPEI